MEVVPARPTSYIYPFFPSPLPQFSTSGQNIKGHKIGNLNETSRVERLQEQTRTDLMNVRTLDKDTLRLAMRQHYIDVPQVLHFALLQVFWKSVLEVNVDP